MNRAPTGSSRVLARNAGARSRGGLAKKDLRTAPSTTAKEAEGRLRIVESKRYNEIVGSFGKQ